MKKVLNSYGIITECPNCKSSDTLPSQTNFCQVFCNDCNKHSPIPIEADLINSDDYIEKVILSLEFKLRLQAQDGILTEKQEGKLELLGALSDLIVKKKMEDPDKDS